MKEQNIVHRKSCLVLFAPSSCHYLMLGCLLSAYYLTFVVSNCDDPQLH